MDEIVPDIFTWAWFSEPHGYNFNGYLVRHTEVASYNGQIKAAVDQSDLRQGPPANEGVSLRTCCAGM